MGNTPNQENPTDNSHVNIILTLEYWPGHGFTQISHRLFATPSDQYDPSTQYGDRPSRTVSQNPRTGTYGYWKPEIIHAFQGTIELGEGENLVDLLHNIEEKLRSGKGGLQMKHHYHSLGPSNNFGDCIVEEPGNDEMRVPLDDVPSERTGIVYDWSRLPEQLSDEEAAKVDIERLVRRFPMVADGLGLKPYSQE